MAQGISGIDGPHGIDFAPDGSRVYVSNESDSTLDVVDPASGPVREVPKRVDTPVIR